MQRVQIYAFPAVSNFVPTEGLTQSALSNNQLTGFTYDTAGNMTVNGSSNYFYDAENRLIATAGTSYIYDGDGDRIEKCTEGATPGTCASGATGTMYWRGTSPDPQAETDLSGNVLENYIFLNGRRIARRDAGTAAVHFYFSDQVGSHGVVLNSTGSTCEQDIDYYPFGGQETDYCASLAQHYMFTGKERDTESGLDNFDFRYYSSSMGRFMKPDEPFGGQDQKDPQTWNMYSYVANRPLNTIDVDGHDVQVCVTNSGQNGQTCYTLKNYQYENLLQQQNGQNGINLPGTGTGNITCGGQVCGTTQYIPEKPLVDESMNLFLIGDSLFSLGRSAVGALAGLFTKDAAEEGGVVIGKMADLDAPGAMKAGERQLDLPNLGNPKANWAQNSSKLREAMAEGKPIRDVSVDSSGNLTKNTGFLRAERNVLENHGWQYDPATTTWNPPSK